ncbi:oxidoreductase [Vibrio breoganii]
MFDSLNGKKILVAGASGLLGKHLVHTLLQRGVKVVAADIDLEALKKYLIENGIEINTDSLSLKCIDITNENAVIELFGEIDKLDGLVNASYPRNATYGNKFFEVDLNSFNSNLSLHLGSAFLLMQQCGKYFLGRPNNEFSLVNIASIYGVVAPNFSVYDGTSMTMPIEYSAIKSAIIHMNKYVTKFICNSKFRVNSVSPGGILANQNLDFQQRYKAETLGEGLLDVKEVLGAILFLLSDESKYINGQNLVVDDGFSI